MVLYTNRILVVVDNNNSQTFAQGIPTDTPDQGSRIYRWSFSLKNQNPKISIIWEKSKRWATQPTFISPGGDVSDDTSALACTRKHPAGCLLSWKESMISSSKTRIRSRWVHRDAIARINSLSSLRGLDPLPAWLAGTPPRHFLDLRS